MSGHWLRHPPKVVVLATIAFAALLIGWSVLTPLAEAPDEPAHLGLILEVARHDGAYPQYDALEQKKGAFWICQTYAVSVKWCPTKAEAAAHTTVRPRPADEAPPKSSRPVWNAGTFTRAVPGRHNQMPQHPPLYYEAMAGALKLERALTPGTWSVDHELAYLRLINVLMVVPLPFLAWATARRAGADDLVGSVAAVSLLGIPQLAHIGGALNNDNLFSTLVGVLAVLLAGVARGDRSARTGILVGLATAGALLTKGFAAVLPPVVVLAYVVGARGQVVAAAGRVRAWLDAARAAVVPVVIAGGVTFLGAGWWYVAKVAATGQLMPSIENARLTSALKHRGFHVSPWKYGTSLVSKLVEGFWGAYGWRSVRIPVPLSFAATLGSLVLVWLAVQRARSSSRRAQVLVAAAESANDHQDRSDEVPAPLGPTAGVLAICSLPFVLFAVFVTVRSWVIYTGTSRLAFQQGRYLFAGLAGMSVLTALGAVLAFGRKRVLEVVVGAVIALQIVGVLAAFHGWWALGWSSGPIQPIRAVVAWSGWPDPIALTLLLVPVVPMGLLVRAIWRASVERTDLRGPDQPEAGGLGALLGGDPADARDQSLTYPR
ncbi:MAG: hypothetical protein JWM89_3443 [Acidimicrobiales bacterium]|nr:hypothetical protein [Acidimicrobiales bacterium]